MSQLDLSIYFSQFLPTLMLMILFLYLLQGKIISFLKSSVTLSKEMISSSFQLFSHSSKSSLIKDILNK